MTELFASIAEDPEGRLRLKKLWTPQFHLEGERKNRKPVQPESSQDLHARLYEFRGEPLEDDLSSMQWCKKYFETVLK